MLNVYQIFSRFQWDSGESWSGSQVMWKGTKCLQITPAHLHKIKSQLSSIIHDDEDYKNKWELM